MRKNLLLWIVYWSLIASAVIVGICALIAMVAPFAMEYIFNLIRLLSVENVDPEDAAVFQSLLEMGPPSLAASLPLGWVLSVIFAIKTFLFWRMAKLIKVWMVGIFASPPTVRQMTQLSIGFFVLYALCIVHTVLLATPYGMAYVAPELAQQSRTDILWNAMISHITPNLNDATALLLGILFLGAARALTDHLKLKEEANELRKDAELTI